MTDRYKNLNLMLFGNFAILNPKGLIANEQKNIIIIAISLMLVVVIPVLVATFVIIWKYRASKKGKYTPTVDRNRTLQLSWLGIISGIVLVLSVLAWQGAHKLDPRKEIQSDTKAITIQVVALQYKWLFIYPEQNLATVNFIQFPVDTPINFEITADAPMNSFWIPQLGGQMYAMSGMKTSLHLMADKMGVYTGRSSNISGDGFAEMTFNATASSKDEFDAWVEASKFYGKNLDIAGYEEIAKPSHNNEVTYFTPQTGLFDSIIMKYMAPMDMKNMDH